MIGVFVILKIRKEVNKTLDLDSKNAKQIKKIRIKKGVYIMDNMLNNKDKLEIKFKELLTENTLLKNKITQLELENERLLKQLQEIKNKSNTYIDIGNYVDYLSNNALEEYRNAYKNIGIESEK